MAYFEIGDFPTYMWQYCVNCIHGEKRTANGCLAPPIHCPIAIWHYHSQYEYCHGEVTELMDTFIPIGEDGKAGACVMFARRKEIT